MGAIGNQAPGLCYHYLYFGPVQHQSAQACQFGDVCKGLRLKAVAGGQVELLQARTRLSDDLHTRFIQEMTAGEFQADQAEPTGLHEAGG